MLILTLTPTLRLGLFARSIQGIVNVGRHSMMSAIDAGLLKNNENKQRENIERVQALELAMLALHNVVPDAMGKLTCPLKNTPTNPHTDTRTQCTRLPARFK